MTTIDEAATPEGRTLQRILDALGVDDLNINSRGLFEQWIREAATSPKPVQGDAVEVCPECDIAGCKHIRERDGREVDKTLHPSDVGKEHWYAGDGLIYDGKNFIRVAPGIETYAMLNMRKQLESLPTAAGADKEDGWCDFPANTPTNLVDMFEGSVPLIFSTSDETGFYLRLGHYRDGDFYESGDKKKLPWRHIGNLIYL